MQQQLGVVAAASSIHHDKRQCEFNDDARLPIA